MHLYTQDACPDIFQESGQVWLQGTGFICSQVRHTEGAPVLTHPPCVLGLLDMMGKNQVWALDSACHYLSSL